MSQLELDILQEKRVIILSLQPEPYDKIVKGVKKYEFRRRFLSKPVYAFIYVSSPIKAIKGFIEFGQPIWDEVEKIGEIAEMDGSGTKDGIKEYMNGLEQGCAIPIISVRQIEGMPLSDLRTRYKFTAPQSYINIESNPLLAKELFKRIRM